MILSKRKLLSTIALGLFVSGSVFAGNKDRVGQAGAGQLLINPWAQSSGWAGANTSGAVGLEAQYLNVSGLASIHKTEIKFVNTNLLKGANINMNAFGIAQRLGESGGVIGISVASITYGATQITTVALPEGGIGTISPQNLNLNLSYAKAFSNSIYGGITVKTISESISNAGASGAAIDVGVRYVTGENDNLKFGIALRNMGPRMKFSGDGLSTPKTVNGNDFTVEQRTQDFELPALLNIGISYDYYLGAAAADSTGESKMKTDHRLTGAFTFTSNSFGKDQLRFGLEYGFRKYFMLRAGYIYESDVTNSTLRTTAYTGPSAGFTGMLPFGKNGGSLAVTYSFRATNSNFSGTHSIGIAVNL